MPIRLKPSDWDFVERCADLFPNKEYTMRKLTAKLDYSYSGKTLWHSKPFLKLIDEKVFVFAGNGEDGSKVFIFNKDKLEKIVLGNIERILKIKLLVTT